MGKRLAMNHRKLIPCIAFLSILFVLAVPQRASGSLSTIPATRDASVEQISSSSNYGSSEGLYLGGTSSEVFKSYLLFDVVAKPLIFTSASINIYVFSFTSSLEVSIWTVSSSWGEYTVTWDNSPEKQDKIMEMTISQTGWLRIDIADLAIKNRYISIVIENAGFPTMDNVAVCHSRESSTGNTPFLEFKFDPSSPRFWGWVLGISAAGLVTVVAITRVIKRKKDKRQTKQKQIPPRDVTGEGREIAVKHAPTPRILKCPYCDAEVPPVEAIKFCQECGKELPRPI
ncbi:MAG: DNRLRE domain-containing protein [Candidatus Hodarchaeota archaeon]